MKLKIERWGEVGMLSAIALLTIVILAVAARAEPYVVSVVQDYVVNVTANNGSLLLMFPNATYNYTLSNASQALAFPVSFSRNVTLFNVTVAPEDNLSCDVAFRDAITNATGYWENVTRAQLVPSVEQYNGLLALRQNDSAQCVVQQNVLSNEIINWRVRLNASELNRKFAAEAHEAQMGKVRNDLTLSNIFAGLMLLGVFGLAWTLLIGRTPARSFKEFVDQTPGGTARFELKPKGKGGGKQ